MRTMKPSSSRSDSSRCARRLHSDKLPPSPTQRRFGNYRHYPSGAARVNAPASGRPKCNRNRLEVFAAEASFYRTLQGRGLRLLTKVDLGMQINSRSTPTGDANSVDSI